MSCFLKVLMATFIMLLSICLRSEAAWFENSRVPELEQQVRELSLTIDTQNDVINEQREKLDSLNKIVEQQNTRIEEQDATISVLKEKKVDLISPFCMMEILAFISGVLFGVVSLFIGLQRRCNTKR